MYHPCPLHIQMIVDTDRLQFPVFWFIVQKKCSTFVPLQKGIFVICVLFNFHINQNWNSLLENYDKRFLLCYEVVIIPNIAIVTIIKLLIIMTCITVGPCAALLTLFPGKLWPLIECSLTMHRMFCVSVDKSLGLYQVCCQQQQVINHHGITMKSTVCTKLTSGLHDLLPELCMRN